MMDREEEKFDLEIRSLMENAEEAVPEHLWAAISDRLDAADAKKRRFVVPLWFRRTAIGVAAAAAIAFGVFLFLPKDNTAQDGQVAVVTSSEDDADTVETNGTATETTAVPTAETAAETAAKADAGPNTEQKGIISDNQAMGNDAAVAMAATEENNINNNTARGKVENGDETSGEIQDNSESQSLINSEYLAEATDTEEEISDSIDENGESGYLAKNAETDNSEYLEEFGEIDGTAVSDYLAEATENRNNEGVAGGEYNFNATIAAADPWNDLLADNGSRYGSRNTNKTRVALVMSGDAVSNASFSSSSSSTTGRQMAMQNVQTKPGISESGDSNYGIPASFGLGVKIIFTPRWSLGVGVNYTLLTRTFAGSYNFYPEGSDILTSANYSKIRHNLSYIGIPINAYFSIVNSRVVDFYAYAGGTVEKAISNRYVLENDGLFKDPVKGLQVSTDVGIGVEFIIVDMVGLYIDPSLRYYIPNSKQPKSIRTQEPLTFGFEIGFRIRL